MFSDILNFLVIVGLGGVLSGGFVLAGAIILIVRFVDKGLSDKLDEKLHRLYIPCGIIMGIVVYIVKYT